MDSLKVYKIIVLFVLVVFAVSVKGTKVGDSIQFKNSGIANFVHDNANQDVKILAASGGDLRLGSGGVNSHVFIQDGGFVGIGTTSPLNLLHMSTPTSGSFAEAQFMLDTHSANPGESGIFFRKTRDNGVITTGDRLGELLFFAHDGTDMSTKAAAVQVISEGTIATNQIPAYIAFDTMNLAGTFAERVRITADGDVGIGTSSPNAELDVRGTVSQGTRYLRFTAATGTIATSSGTATFDFDLGEISNGGDVEVLVTGVYASDTAKANTRVFGGSFWHYDNSLSDNNTANIRFSGAEVANLVASLSAVGSGYKARVTITNTSSTQTFSGMVTVTFNTLGAVKSV